MIVRPFCVLKGAQRLVFSTLFFAVLLSWPNWLCAQEPETSEGYPTLDNFHEAVQDSVREAAHILDDFFSNKEYEQERNDTSLRLRFDLDLNENDDTAFRFRPKLRLRLPGTERTFLFEAQGASEAIDEEGGIQRTDLFKGAVEDDPFEISLKLFQSRGRTLLTPEIGVGIEDEEPKAFAGVRIRYQWRFGDDWSMLASERVRAHTNRGVESISLLRADTFILDDVLWRNDFQLRWRADEDGLRYGPGTALYVPLDKKTAVGLETSFYMTTEPSNEVDQIAATFRFRRKVLTDWSTIELAPGINFDNDRDYDPSASLLVRLELQF
jgi:hypothetical protein